MCAPSASTRPRSRRGARAEAKLVERTDGAGAQQPAGPARRDGRPRRRPSPRAPAPSAARLGRDVLGARDDPATGARPSRSSHATRCGPPGSAAARARRRGRPARSVSTDSSALVTGRSAIRAQRITPVSPIPPIVAANRSDRPRRRARAPRRPRSAARAPRRGCRTSRRCRGSCRGCRWRSRRRRSRAGCPGRPGRIQPARHERGQQLAERHAGLRRSPSPCSASSSKPLQPRRVEHEAAGELRGVAVAAAQPARDRAGRGADTRERRAASARRSLAAHERRARARRRRPSR